MSVIYRPSLRTTRLNRVRDDIDSGAGPGKLKLCKTDGTVIVTIPLNDPCGTVSGDVLTINATGMSATASLAGTNTATKAIITTSNDAEIIVDDLSVGTGGSGADVELNSTSITFGQTVTITSATITHASE